MATEKKNENLALIKKDTVDVVAERVRQFQEKGELHFPANYSPENAMKAAWLTIQETTDKNEKPALEVCTKNSIANALLNMVIQGLNPAKKQCYFIVYGNQLTLQRSYFGSIHIAKTVDPNIQDINAEVVYEGQPFRYQRQRGYTVITEHEMQLGDNAKPIVGAYAQVLYKDGRENSTVMSFEEIKAAWEKSPTHPVEDTGEIKAKSTHGKYTAEMSKKTVINRACKSIINTSDDSSLLIMAYRQTDADIAEAEAAIEIDERANKQPIIIDSDTNQIMNTQHEAKIITSTNNEDPGTSAANPDYDDLP